ncbi:hypothetical protein ACJX0J_017452 [Zea mays]
MKPFLHYKNKYVCHLRNLLKLWIVKLDCNITLKVCYVLMFSILGHNLNFLNVLGLFFTNDTTLEIQNHLTLKKLHEQEAQHQKYSASPAIRYNKTLSTQLYLKYKAYLLTNICPYFQYFNINNHIKINIIKITILFH